MTLHKPLLILALVICANSCRSSNTQEESAEDRRERRFGEHGKYLREASRLEIFSVAPRSDFQPLESLSDVRFHSFQTYGMTSTTDQSDIATIWSQLHQRIDSEPGESYAMCFLPRHAIRAFHGEDSRDYLICFECDHLYVYREQEADDYERIGLEKGNQPLKLNELIDRAKIPRDHPSCKSVTLSRSAQSPWAFRRNAPR